MIDQSADEIPGRSTRRIVCTAFVTALLVAVVGIALSATWLSGARDPGCGDSDCDQGVALIAMFFGLVSLVAGTLAGVITGGVLAARNLSPGQRSGMARRVAMAALLPLSLVLLYLYAAT